MRWCTGKKVKAPPNSVAPSVLAIQAAGGGRVCRRSLKRRAKRLLGLGSVDQALTGSVAVVQRTDSAVRLNVHIHRLALDGVYVEDERGELDFHALGVPSSVEVADIARRTARRVHRAFKKKGRPSPWDQEHALGDSGEADPRSIEQPGLFTCYQAAAAGIAVSGERAGQPLLRLIAGGPADPEPSSDRAASSEPVAEVFGVHLYAKQWVDGRDSQQLERLCRYVMRPPLSQERLQWCPDGRLELTLKNVWKDGTRPVGVLVGFGAGPMARRALPEAGWRSGLPTWLGDLPLAPRKGAVRLALAQRLSFARYGRFCGKRRPCMPLNWAARC